MLTHYHTLKVAEDAPPEVIKAAYRALSQQRHPDSNQESQEEAVRAMQAINEAYEALIDPETRAVYDERLRMERAAAAEAGFGDGSEAATGRRGGGLVKKEPDDSAAITPRRRRRHRSRTSSHRSGHALVPASSEVYLRSSDRSQAGALVRSEPSLAPMFSSAQSTTIIGRMLPNTVAGPNDAPTTSKPRKRGCSILWIAITACLLGVLLLGGLVVWRVGLVHRFWAWFQREQALEASRGLVFGGYNDVMPLANPEERPYDRPALTPHGRPWPENTGYLEGAKQLHNQGGCEIVVDNVLHDADVHAKLVALPGDAGGAALTVREAFISKRSQMSFENLLPGKYELRYRALNNGLIFRVATIELLQEASKPSASRTVSLYKVVPGNVQRPIISEDTFEATDKAN